jgi:hypothetical protein
MKKIIIALVALSSISAFAQVFRGGSEVSPSTRNQENSHILITGKSAKKLFDKLEIPAKNDSFGPFNYSRKGAKQITCTLERMVPQTNPATPDSYYCALLLAPNGEILNVDEL